MKTVFPTFWYSFLSLCQPNVICENIKNGNWRHLLGFEPDSSYFIDQYFQRDWGVISRYTAELWTMFGKPIISHCQAFKCSTFSFLKIPPWMFQNIKMKKAKERTGLSTVTEHSPSGYVLERQDTQTSYLILFPLRVSHCARPFTYMTFYNPTMLPRKSCCPTLGRVN